ncbi:MAG: MerR family transcriptional regulator [bacterium]|nr:MerR family transcriptional regulator [bacterium]
MPETYTTAEVAELTGLSIRQLQAWDESGFVTALRSRPGADRYYNRRQVLLLTLIEALLSSGLSLQRIRRCRLKRLIMGGYLAVGSHGSTVQALDGDHLLSMMAGSAEQFTVIDLAALGKGIG